MSLGAGIAIAGIWLFAGACAISKEVTGAGLFLAAVVALTATMVVSTAGMP